MTATNKLRWGILGCANIAIHSVIPGIQQSALGEVAAIASRNGEKAKETAEKCGIPRSYDTYEALLADPSIDAVYIPLPNHLHKEWTVRAAEAGKHVLCEKPLALTAQEAAEMVSACDHAGVKLAEAFMYRHHPRYTQIKEVINSGEIGIIRGIHSTFTFNNAGDRGNIRYKREWGGGSLYDVGCYPLSVARLLLEEEPQAVTVHAFFSPEHDQVDMMASGLVEFSDGVGLTFDCGMWAAFRNTLEIVGTEGNIMVPSAFVSQADASSHFFVTTAKGHREVEVPHVNQYSLQADDFARSVLEGTSLLFPASDAINNMALLDACLKSARTRARIALSE
ncbi:Gfo/Idh/MocA family protein [Laceyella putida]|uniref:Gfo/Idh/MocA family protein n=1 Tax=Laceyella putida TaxID=110101 RepID=A0ABW2RQ85_9BACL